MKNARPQNSKTSALDKRDSNTKDELFSELSVENLRPRPKAIFSKFAGTENPRHLRAITALLQRARFKNDLQAITGASNTPELVAELRRRGLETPCEKVPMIDRDGLIVHPGIYSFSERDRRKLHAWMRERDAGNGCAA